MDVGDRTGQTNPSSREFQPGGVGRWVEVPQGDEYPVRRGGTHNKSQGANPENKVLFSPGLDLYVDTMEVSRGS